MINPENTINPNSVIPVIPVIPPPPLTPIKQRFLMNKMARKHLIIGDEFNFGDY